jgi:hypothetical protein
MPGNETLSYTPTLKWCVCVQEEYKDTSWSGQPKMTQQPKLVVKVCKLTAAYHQRTLRMMANKLNVGKDMVRASCSSFWPSF